MNWIRKIGMLGPLAAFSMVMPPVSGLLLLGTMHKVGPWLRAQDETGVIAYVTAFTVLGGLALLPTYAPSLLAGWAFGGPLGIAATLSGFLGAAIVNYVVSRRVSGARADALLAKVPRWHAVRGALLGSGFWKATLIVTLLRLPPNAPFAASNVAMAAVRVPLGPYALGTLAGLAPRTSAVVLLGAGLSVLDFSNRGQAGWFLAGVVVTFAVLGALGWMARRALADLEARESAGAPAPPPRRVIVYDGTCVFCTRSAGWIAARDPEGRFRFTTSGSRAAAALLDGSGLDAAAPGTIVLVEGGEVLTRSDAVLRIAGQLRGPASWLAGLRVVPRPVRDGVYRLIARLRHRLAAGRPCPAPSAGVRARTIT